ncbi:hypothetical protein P3T76_014104 [Phytophthora citrophthora]|uniref:Crinkler effector protein N-terminal domain-containing protein n=1 Tax=Phytophthora citrophthora TaxID=4793 RepID=A0AAD9G2N0_9STRA|nr:hypothetical protein P3T76_014104 [Phytophthora citrophthora]
MKLFCAIVGVAGNAFEVDIAEDASVSALKDVIKEKNRVTITCDAKDLQLFLARTKDGAWLGLDEAGAASVALDKGGHPQHLNTKLVGMGSMERINKCVGNLPDQDQVHVLVKVPLSNSERQWVELLSSLSWNDTKSLCSSHGSTWKYQGKPELVETLVEPLVGHYNAWKRGDEDKQNHALHLVMSGPGTGKSRMLDEMKGLLYEAAVRSKDQTLIDRMEKPYVFRVTFENGTQATGSLFNPAIPELDISYRMLYQFWTGGTTFGIFSYHLQTFTEQRLGIEDVIGILAKLEKKDVKEMTVILCVDAFQHLMNDGSKDCPFYRVMRSVCGFLNSSRAFTVCVCSATIEKPVSEALAGSPQKRLFLVPPALDGKEIFKPETPTKKLLVGDMGGHGRALETLDLVLQQEGAHVEELDPISVIKKVVDELKHVYPGLFDRGVFTPAVCKELMSAIISQRRYDVTDAIGDLTVDKLRSLGLFRLTSEGRLECAFIFLVELMRNLPALVDEISNFDEQLTRSVTTWQQFERFVGFYRMIKSIAFRGTPISLSKFHAGARFANIEGVKITERSPRKLVQAVSQHDTNSGSGVLSVTTSEHGNVAISDMDTVIINGTSAQAGDLFMGIELTTIGGQQVQCNEVIQCKFLHTKAKFKEETYAEEREKAVDDSDVFLLITSSPVAKFDPPPRCGIVSIEDFPQYFGPFASRAFRSLLAPPNINVAPYQVLCLVEGLGRKTADKIVQERAKQKFTDVDDAVNRLCDNPKCATAKALRLLYWRYSNSNVDTFMQT